MAHAFVDIVQMRWSSQLLPWLLYSCRLVLQVAQIDRPSSCSKWTGSAVKSEGQPATHAFENFLRRGDVLISLMKLLL